MSDSRASGDDPSLSLTSSEGPDVEGLLDTAEPPRRDVLLVDLPERRVRRPSDLIGLIGSVVGIVVVLLLAVYAHATATAVTEDVQFAATAILRQLLLFPVTVLEGLVTFFLPLLVVTLQLIQRRWRNVAESLLAAVAAGALSAGAVWLIARYGPSALSTGLTITTDGATVIALNHFAAALAALLTAVSRRTASTAVRWSWTLLWIVLGLSVIRGDLTLPGAVVTVLLGRATGLAVRYAAGTFNERANGIGLVQGVRRAGIDVARIVRLDPPRSSLAPQAWRVTTSAPIGYTERLREEGPTARARHEVDPLTFEFSRSPDTIVADALTDPEAVVAAASPTGGVTVDPMGAHRVYSVWDVEGTRWHLVALDGDRQVVGYLASIWTQIRRRGFRQRQSSSLRDAADRAALLSYAAQQAGVRTPPLAGIAQAQDSVLIATRHIDNARRMSVVPASEITDEVLDETWRQLRLAHSHGLAHQDLTAAAVMIEGEATVWLLDWENGDIASSELARRMDLAQLLALTATKVGEERALASAARNLGREQLASIAPLLQPIVLPAETRALAGKTRELLNSLRSRLVDQVPAADVEPVRVARFSVRTVVMLSIAIVAVWLVLGSLNFEQVLEATRNANPWWLVVTFVLGLLSYVGSAMGLVAFSPERIGVWRTTLVQVAAGVITLVAPAGVGPAALNLRFLIKQRVATPLAVATVALVQVSQFVTTVLLLVALALITGSVGTLSLPTGAVNVALIIVLVVGTAVLAIPPLRAWLWKKLGPMLRQVWPRVLWVVGSPSRVIMGLSGNIIMTVGFVGAFGAALAAFGQTLPVTTLAITYLTSNTVGAAVPAPGGIGPVEAALTGGLTVAGISAGVAFSTAMVFRVLTFWMRVPLGWMALRYLQRHNAV